MQTLVDQTIFLLKHNKDFNKISLRYQQYNGQLRMSPLISEKLFCEVYRVPGFLSSRPNWVSPPPHPQASVATTFWVQGGHTLLRGREWGDPIPTNGQTLCLCPRENYYKRHFRSRNAFSLQKCRSIFSLQHFIRKVSKTPKNWCFYFRKAFRNTPASYYLGRKVEKNK